VEQDRAPAVFVHFDELEGHAAGQLNLIAATTTTTGLTVKCELDTTHYPKAFVVSKENMDSINITRDAFHGEWNYAIRPSAKQRPCQLKRLSSDGP
jgi:hypothetical protein